MKNGMHDKIWLCEESGQGMVEYTSILIGISIAAIALMSNVADKIENMFQYVIDQMP